MIKPKALVRLLSPVRSVILSLVGRGLATGARDLEMHASWIAGQTSAAYIAEHLPTALAIRSQNEILHFAVERANTSFASRDCLYLEFGVYQGKTINQIAAVAPEQDVYGFDSFEGLPEDWRTGFGKGRFATTMPKVRPNVRLIKGWFNETLPSFVAQHTQDVGFLHVDCDLYSSTMTIFDNLRAQLKPGTIILFDEYFNYPGWQQGEHKALLDFSNAHGFSFRYLAYNPRHEQCVVELI